MKADVNYWHNPDKEMPEEVNGISKDVLCWYEYFRYGSYNRMFRTYGIGYTVHGRWGGDVACGQRAKVLRWMPLPKAPRVRRTKSQIPKELGEVVSKEITEQGIVVKIKPTEEAREFFAKGDDVVFQDIKSGKGLKPLSPDEDRIAPGLLRIK